MTATPSGWAEARFRDVLKPRYGKALPVGRRDRAARYPVVGSAGVMTATAEALVREPVVVIGRKGNVGEVRYLRDGCWPIDTTYYVIVPNHMDANYLTNYLRHLDLKRLDSSTATPSLRRQDLEAQVLRFPALAEQRRIVEILEEHLSHLDAADAEVARAGARLEGLLESALRSVIPNSTTMLPLGDLLDVPLSNGRSVPTRPGGFPVLRLTALKEDGVDLAEKKEGAWDLAAAQRFLVSKGDFLIARGNGSLRLVGRGSLVRDEPDEVAFPDTAIRARPRTAQLLPDFLDLVWSSRATRDQIERVARTSAGIYKVNQSHLEAIRLPVPDPSQQLRILAAMTDLREQRRTLRQAVSTVTQRSGVLRRAVLAAAFEGKLTGRRTDHVVIEESAQG